MLNPESHGHWMCKDKSKCDRKPGCMLVLMCNEDAEPVGNAELTCRDTGGNMEWLPDGIGHCEKKCKAKTTAATTSATITTASVAVTTTTVKGSFYASSLIRFYYQPQMNQNFSNLNTKRLKTKTD